MRHCIGDYYGDYSIIVSRGLDYRLCRSQGLGLTVKDYIGLCQDGAGRVYRDYIQF